MALPGSPALLKLHLLDGSSPDFDDQVCNVLYGEGYARCVPDLREDDLVWLINYLDRVRRCVVFLQSLINPRIGYQRP